MLYKTFPIFIRNANIHPQWPPKLLLWDHIALDRYVQDIINKKLGRKNAPYEGKGCLRMFQERSDTLEEAFYYETVGDRRKYFTALGKRCISWALGVNTGDAWEIIGMSLPSTNSKTYWTGCQIPNTLYFLVTDADNATQCPILDTPATVPTQTIWLYQLNPSTLLLEKLKKQSAEMKTKRYHPRPWHWRDPHPVLQLGHRKVQGAPNNQRYYFCAVDAQGQACIGVLRVENVDISPCIVYEDPFSPEPEAGLPELEVPVGVQTPSGEYLIASSIKDGVTGTYSWVKLNNTNIWLPCNDGKPLSFDMPKGFTLYAAKCHKGEKDELLLSGWISRQGFIYAQSQEYILYLQGQTVELR
jgi:hypothetical protein